jgi:hypothetical protein
MYKYLIDEELISFNSEAEAADALIEAENNNLVWEPVTDPVTDGPTTVKTEEEAKADALKASRPIGFQPGPAADVDVAPEITTSKDTGSNLGGGSSGSQDPVEETDLTISEGDKELSSNMLPWHMKRLDPNLPKNLEELMASPFSKPSKEDAKIVEAFANSLPEIKQKRIETGRAKVITKDFLEKGIYQLDNGLSGESITEKDDSGELTQLAIKNAQDYFYRQPEATLLDSDQIEAIVFNQINDFKKKESLAKNNEAVAVWAIMQEQGNSEAFEKATISTRWNTYSRNKKGLVIANQELAKATADNDGSEESVKNIIKLKQNQATAQNNYRDGSTNLFDINTGERLNKPEAIQYEAEGMATADYSDQIKDAMDALPTDRDKLKAAWLGNAARKEELKKDLQRKVTLVSKPGRGNGIEKEYTFEDLMKLRNLGTNLEILDVVIPDGVKGDAITQSISNQMFDDLNSERRALNIRGEALDQSYLLNIDPGSIKKTKAGLLSQFEKVVLKSTFGDVIEDFVPQTQRDLFDSTESVFSDLGIKATEAQKKNFERTFAMQATEGVGYFVPELAKFAVANTITGGVLGAAKTMVYTANGWKAITWANRLNQLKRSGSTLNKAKGLLFDATIEEIKFKGVTAGESKTGGGVGFALGGAAMRKLIPFRFRGDLAIFNPTVEKILLGGVGGATSSEVALVVEDLYKAATSDKDLMTLLKNSFVKDAQGNDVDFINRVLVNAVVFSAIGATHMKPKDFRKMSTVRRLNARYAGEIDLENNLKKQGKGELSETEYANLIDKFAQTDAVLAVADKAYRNLTLDAIKKERDLAQQWISTNPEERGDTFNSRADAQSVIDRYDLAANRVRSKVYGILEQVGKSNIMGGDFKFKVDDRKTGDKAGEFLSDKNEITINIGDFNAGITEHEINHAIVNKLVSESPNLAPILRKILEPVVSKKLKGVKFKHEGESLEFSEWIDKVHKGKDDKYKADEYISYLVEAFNKPNLRDKLIDTGIIVDLKNSVTTMMENLGMKKGVFKDVVNLEEGNLNRASDVLAFFDQLSNGGKKAKNWRSKFETYNQMAIDAKKLDLVDIPTGRKVESLEKGVNDVMNSVGMKEVTADFKNKNLEKINAEFEKMKADGADPQSIGVNIGFKFQDIANKTMESYLKQKDLNIDSDTKYDIVADLMYEAIPKSVETYLAGQRFIEYVKDNKLSKEDAAVEFKNRGLRETSGSDRFDKLYGFANGVGKEATITTYILNDLSKKLIGVFQMPKYEGIFKNISFDAEKIDKLQESGEIAIPESEQGYIDTSSPIQKVQRTRKSAEAILGLSTKTIEKVNKVVDNVLKEPVKDLDARAIGTIDTGSGGSYKIAMIDKNQARVTYPNGKAEIMLGARSPIIIINKILAKLKSGAFQNLRKPNATEAEKADAQAKFDEYSTLMKNPPKYIKGKILKTELGLTIEKGIYEEMSKDAGGLGTPEYQGFIDRSFPLFKTYLSQRAINKRFPEFKEPILNAEGKQVRAKTAAGAPLFLKKDITLAEWRKYHTGKDSPDLQLRRTTLLESLSRELGFDRVMEITIKEGLREQLENNQIAVGNKLEANYVAAFQRGVDRGVKGGGMASRGLEQYATDRKIGLDVVLKRFNGIFTSDEDINLNNIKGSDKEFALEIINLTNSINVNALEGGSIGKKARDKGVGGAIELGSKMTDPNKTMSARSKSERADLGPAIVTFEQLASQFVTSASTNQNSNLQRLFSNMFGFTSREGSQGEKVNATEYENIIKANKGTTKTIESSSDLKGAWATAENLLKETSLVGENAKGEKDINGDFLTNTFNRNIDAFIDKVNEIQLKPKGPRQSEFDAIMHRFNELDIYAKTPEGLTAIKDIKFKDALLEASLMTFGEMTLKMPASQKAKVADLLASTLLNNDGVGFRSLSSQRYFAFTAEGSPAIITSVAIDPITKKKLTKNDLKEYNKNNKEVAYIDVKSRATVKNEHLDPKQKFGVRVMEALIRGDLSNPENVEALTSGYNSLYGSERYQRVADSKIGAVRSLNKYKKMIAATTKPTKETEARIKKMIEGELTVEDLAALSRIYDIITKKSALDELIADTVKNIENAIVKATKEAANNNKEAGFDGDSTGQQLNTVTARSSKASEGLTESGELNRERLEVKNKKTGGSRFETDKEYAERLKNIEANSPELYLPKALAEMIERKGGAKADAEVSDSKAFNAGKKRYDDLFLPANSEDFQGLLYKVYGKGKQGDKDMAFIKENILRPYTRAENDLSVYRMNLVVDYKALETQMKAMGEGKAEVASVKRVEKLGYNIDQAVRVYIWSRLGKEIPGISEAEVAQLTGAVHNSPRLQAYAKGLMTITKTKEKYPDPTPNWFKSNVQYDLFTYATDGVRADFLAPWQSNVDAMFTKQNLNRLEARFGPKYVYNLKTMMTRMSKGKSRPESTNDSFNKALDYVNGSVATIMFLNMRSAGLQTISAANYVNWADNNPMAIGKVITENPKLFLETAKKVWSSDALKDRRTGLRINVEEAEMAKAINAGGRTNLQGLWDVMVRVGFKPTQMADSFAIVTGGTPFYMNRTKTYMKGGLSKPEAEAKAWEDFLDLTQEGQQSSQMDRVSNIQTGLMGRLVFSFNNTPFQMSRLQKKSALDLINGRGDTKTNISKLAYYAFVQSALFYGLQQGFYSSIMSEDDDDLTEKQKEAKYKDFDKRLDRIGVSTFQGILTGSGLPGKVTVTAYNTIMQAVEQYDKGYAGKDFFPILNKALSISPTLGSKSSRMGRNWNGLMYSDFTKRGKEIKATYGDFDPNHPNSKAYLSMLGTMTNVPLDRIIQKMDNIQGVLDKNNENWERAAMFMGAPKWSLQTAEDNKADMDERLDKFYKETVPKRERDSIGAKDLTKKAQEELIIDLGITRGEYKSLTNEKLRVNYILNKAKKDSIDLEKLIPKYVIPKEEKTKQYLKLEELTKEEQQERLISLQVTRGEYKKASTADARIKLIIKKLKEKTTSNKNNSLK